MSKLTTFISDFKESVIYNKIINDPNVDVILMWMTGSTVTGLKDEESDYDICVLVRKNRREPDDFP